MSAEDPTEELDEMLDLVAAGELPKKAADWANSTSGTAEEILETIDSMVANGVDAPTGSQEEALYNIYVGACRWLHRPRRRIAGRHRPWR